MCLRVYLRLFKKIRKKPLQKKNHKAKWKNEMEKIDWHFLFVVSNVISSMMAIVWGWKKGENLPKGKEYSTRYLSDKGLK